MKERKKNRRSQGSGSVYQRASDGRWISVVDLGWVEGKRKRKYFVSRTQDEATRKLNRALGEYGRGALMAADRTTIAEYMTAWLEDSARHNLRDHSYRNYKSVIDTHIIPHIGNRRLDQLTPQHVQAMINSLSKSGLSPRSVQSVRAVLSAALKDAMKLGIVWRNVATLVRMPPIKPYEGSPLSPQEARQLIRHLEGNPLEALVTLSLALGLRQGEVLGLRWQDIDLDSQTMRIQQQYIAGAKITPLTDEDMAALATMTPTERTKFHLKRYAPRFASPKTDRSRRPLPIPAPVIPLLKRHKTDQIQDRLLAGERWIDLGLVFTSVTGGPMDPSRLSRQFTALFKPAGLEPRKFHDLRRSCASLLAAWNVPAPVVRDILGHSDINVTLNVYTRTFSDDIRSAVDLMGNLFEEPESEAK
jgi:integrase